MKKYLVYTDGASRGNPGHSSAGFIIQGSDGVIWAEEGVYLGIGTNNEAEYKAVALAFEKLLKDFSKQLPCEIELRADSQLVIRQLLGQYKIKNPRLKIIFDRIRSFQSQLGEVRFTHVSREQNFLADKMANLALDRYLAHD